MSTQTPQDQYVEVGPINTRYWALGEGGTPVILIHGIGGYAEDWALTIPALAEEHRVYAPDLVGFGRSDKPPASYSLSYLAQFVHEFMVTQGIERASLVGWSLGGAVALQFALEFPDKLDKLVLVSSGGLGREVTITLRLMTLPFVGELLGRPGRKGTAQFLKECVYDPSLVTDELVELSYQMSALPGAQKSFLTTLRAIGSTRGQRATVLHPILNGLGAITAPTLLVWGEKDRIVPVAHVHIAEERLPNARCHIFERCGHMPPLEKPAEFNALVLEFLSR